METDHPIGTRNWTPSASAAHGHLCAGPTWLPAHAGPIKTKWVFKFSRYSNSAPCESITQTIVMDGRWSNLFCPSKNQVKNFIMTHFARKKKTVQHAPDREGKRSYTQFSLAWLKKEVTHRGLTVGNRKTPGCIKLLESHDDENEGKLTKFHNTTDDRRSSQSFV